MSTFTRCLLALLAAGLSHVLSAAPAAAGPLIDDVDAEEMAVMLAEAEEAQGICYGWQVLVQDDDGTFSGEEIGSSRGPGVDASTCDKYVIFAGQIHYTSELSESSDEANFSIVSSGVSPAPTDDDLGRVGIDTKGLLSDNDDVEIGDAVLALPALVAELGAAPPVPVEENTEALPDADHLENSPGSDWIRERWPLLALAGSLVLIGAVVVAVGLLGPATALGIVEE